jgi:hypothetical protein
MCIISFIFLNVELEFQYDEWMSAITDVVIGRSGTQSSFCDSKIHIQLTGHFRFLRAKIGYLNSEE